MNFDKIVIHFENCEAVTIPFKDITSITLKGITRNYHFQNYHFQTDIHCSLTDSHEYETADYIDITLASTANNIENMQPLFDNDNVLPFERIQAHDDIITIEFHKDNKKIRTIEALWHETNIYSNEFQESFEVSGSLIITIGV